MVFFSLRLPCPLRSTLFPYTTLFRSEGEIKFYLDGDEEFPTICGTGTEDYFCGAYDFDVGIIEKDHPGGNSSDRKSTRLNSSHQIISYAVFCLKKKNTNTTHTGANAR